MIQIKNVSHFIQSTAILKQISCSFTEGKIYGIIGPNGAGKSTLLQLLSGTVKPSSGEICLDDKPVHLIARKKLARYMAVLLQEGIPPLGFTVREIAAMGRFPYQNWLGGEAADVENMIDEALAAMGIEHLQHRKLEQLSGGERQRVALAKLMVQNPSLLLLDGPTTYLDIGYQMQLMDQVKAWQQERKLTVIAVLHDLNLAAMYCDEIMVLHQGEIAAVGTPGQVVTSELLGNVYNTKAVVFDHPEIQVPQVLLTPGN